MVYEKSGSSVRLFARDGAAKADKSGRSVVLEIEIAK
jgi:hypothetical protein